MKALCLTLLAIVGGGLALALLQKRGEAHLLRAELELARMERDEVEQLRHAQHRLQTHAPTDSALRMLREEQAVVHRLRAELASFETKP